MTRLRTTASALVPLALVLASTITALADALT